MFIRAAKAQSISEYVIFLGLIVATFVGFQIFVQRTLQGHLKISADVLGEQEERDRAGNPNGKSNWEQSDWRKGAAEYKSTVTNSTIVPEEEVKKVTCEGRKCLPSDTKGGDLVIERNIAQSQETLSQGEYTGKGMSEGY